MLSIRGVISRARFAIVGTIYRVELLKFSTDMNARMLSSYEEAVYALNGLQSNAAVLQKAYEEKDVNAGKKLAEVGKHLGTLGVQASDLDSLNIIHVAGTKGKGSTCAFVESILRKHGYKTGFYSSPHLVSVNERIRINGMPIDKNLFVKYFWEVYNPLQNSLENGATMPPYFMFLTIMAYYVFVKEQIQAAVIEVGIGGTYDCTNIIKKPVATAVTSLGIDHVNLLGNTLPLIAQQKAGIFKSGVPAFTVPQKENAMKVLIDRAKEVNCSLKVAPPIEIYEQKVDLGDPGFVQNINASLAIQLAALWLKTCSKNQSVDLKELRSAFSETGSSINIPMAASFPLTPEFIEGLESCKWPGRYQIIETKDVTLYLDGAHTNQSIKFCAKWFQESSEKQRNMLQSSVLRVLLFNCTGKRAVENLLDPLSDLNFDLVLFSPNRKHVMKDSSSDQSNFTVDPEEEVQQCMYNKEIWGHLIRSMNENALSIVGQSNSSVLKHDSKAALLKEDNALSFCCLSHAVDWVVYKKNINCLSCGKNNTFLRLLNEARHIQVLVTGSLHLVGGVLALVDS